MLAEIRDEYAQGDQVPLEANDARFARRLQEEACGCRMQACSPIDEIIQN